MHSQIAELKERWLHSDENTPIDVDSPPESLFVTGTAILAGVATRNCLKAAWKGAKKNDPPVNPAADGVSWTDALIWAAAVGAAVGVSRVLSRRSVTAAVRKYRE